MTQREGVSINSWQPGGELGVFSVNVITRGLAAIAKLILPLIVVNEVSFAEYGMFSLFVIYVDYGRQLIGWSFYIHTIREMPRQSPATWEQMLSSQSVFHLSAAVITSPILLLFIKFNLLSINLIGLFSAIVILDTFVNQSENILIGAGHSIKGSILVFLRIGAWVLVPLTAVFVKVIMFDMSLVYYSWLSGELLASGIAVLWMYGMGIRKFCDRLDIGFLWMGVKVGGKMTISTIGVLIILTSSRIILEQFHGSHDVGIISLFYGLSSGAASIVYASVFAIALPRLLALEARGDRQKLRFEFRRVAVRVATATLLAVSIAYIAIPKVLEVMGRTADAPLVLFLATAAAGGYGFSYIPHYWLYVHRYDNQLVWSTWISAGLSLGLTMLLVPRGGLIGAAWALAAGVWLLLIMRCLTVWWILYWQDSP